MFLRAMTTVVLVGLHACMLGCSWATSRDYYPSLIAVSEERVMCFSPPRVCPRRILPEGASRTKRCLCWRAS